MTDDVRALSDAFADFLSEHMPRPKGKEDWHYRDLPQMREDFFNDFVELIGEENIVWLTRAQYQHEDGLYKRGQLFMSPEGMERVSAYARSIAN